MQRNRPSFTAVSVARTPYLDAKYQRVGMLPQAYVEQMATLQAACGIVKPWHEKFAQARIAQTPIRFAFKKLAPGLDSHLTLRKRYILDQVEAALAAGATNVINIGAGFDSLCLYGAKKYPYARFFEIDHPVTSQGKEQGIRQSGGPPANFSLIAADLSVKKFEDVFRGLERSDGLCVFVLEGLLMYLHEQDVRGLLQDIARLAPPRSRVILTHLSADSTDKPLLGPLSGLSRLTLQALGEPVHWGIQPKKVPAFLGSVGLQVVDQPAPQEVFVRYVGPHSGNIMPLEWFVTANVTNSVP